METFRTRIEVIGLFSKFLKPVSIDLSIILYSSNHNFVLADRFQGNIPDPEIFLLCHMTFWEHGLLVDHTFDSLATCINTLLHLVCM